MSLPEEVLSTTSLWLEEFRRTWHEEVPVQIHSGDVDAGGAPEFHPSFIAFIERDCRKPGCFNLSCQHGQDRPNPRKRTHKAFRKLRRVAPREFDAIYLLVAHRMSFGDVAVAMTDRAIRLEKPERYSEGGILILVVSAIDKLSQWY